MTNRWLWIVERVTIAVVLVSGALLCFVGVSLLFWSNTRVAGLLFTLGLVFLFVAVAYAFRPRKKPAGESKELGDKEGGDTQKD